MNSKLLPLIRTKAEANELVGELELLKKSIFENDEKSFQSTLNNNTRHWVAEIIKEEIKEEDKEKYLDQLLISIQQLDDFKITLAFEPSNSGINMFLDYLRQNVNDSVILEIEHDRTILGGAVISYQGKYHDFSLLNLFESEFNEKREEFSSLIQTKLNSVNKNTETTSKQ